MQEASYGMSRTFPPTAPVGRVYRSAPMPRTKGFSNQLDRLVDTFPKGIDPRLTAQGTAPTRKLPPYVPYGYLDPRNVFSMRPQ